MIQVTFILLFVAVMAPFCNSAYIPIPVYTYHDAQTSYPSPARTPAITSTSSNILRTPGNLGQVSTYHKSVDTPFSSVRKADVRISNDALTYPAIHVPLHVPTPLHAVHTPLAITYSGVPTVAHLTFDGFGTHYAW